MSVATWVRSSGVLVRLGIFLVAALLWYFGEPIRAFIERRLTLLTTLFAALVVGGVLMVTLL